MSRTTATILFTDLVGSTELRGRLGEEAADDLRRRHDRLLSEAVEGHGGRVVKGLGDGIMATFGGASDGVAAAVAIQQAVGRLNRTGKTPIPLAVRVGLSAGDVTVEAEDVHGTPVIEASRLCGAAEGGRILLSEVVRLLAGASGPWALEQRGQLDLKGLSDPVSAWEVRWEPTTVSTIPMPALLTDVGRIFVGRDAELERLQQLWKEATAGERPVALVAGEPGVGKTRLAAELSIRVYDEGGTVLAGRCDEDLGVPYQPFVETLRHFVDHTPPPELRERLGRYGGELVRLVPELSERLADLTSPLLSDPETERYRLFDAVAAWLSAASSEDPILLVLDDLQWAAKPTLLLLRHIVRASDPGRLLILGTYRDTELTHDHPLVELVADLRREGALERVPLSGLDDLAVTAIVEQAAGQALDEDGVALARAIYQETEGNPFFVREVLRHLVETKAVERQADGWATRVPIEQLGIPEGVRDVVGRRLSRLSQGANQALRLAAVVGAEFDVELVGAAGELAETDLLGTLDEAAEARLVSEVSPSRFRFSHALVRATLYESLTGTRRAGLHRRVGEAIEALHGDRLDDFLPALAHHWAQASSAFGENPRALDYARRAGDRALAQLAHDEAAGYYRQALELLEVSGRRSGIEHCELMISLGEAERLAGNPAHRETLLRACRRAQDLRDARLLCRAALSNRSGLFSAVGAVDDEKIAALEAALEALDSSESRARAKILAALSIELHFAGAEQRVELVHQALAIARQLDDPATLGEVLVALWLATLPTASAERADLARQLAEVAGRINDPVLEFYVGLARFLTALELGEMTAADEGLAACRRIAEDLGQPVLQWRAAYLQIQRALVDGDLAKAEALAEEALRLGEAAGQADASGFADVYWVRILQGRTEEAVELLRPIVQRFGATKGIVALMAWVCAEGGLVEEAGAIVADLRGDSFGELRPDYLWPATLALLGRACARLHDTSNAAELYELLRPHHAAILVAQSVWFGPLAYDLGLLAAALGRIDDADRHFAEAVAIHDRLGVRGMLAHTLLDWARTLLSRRTPADVDRALELLARAQTTAADLGLAHIGKQALAALEEIR